MTTSIHGLSRTGEVLARKNMAPFLKLVAIPGTSYLLTLFCNHVR